MTVTVGIWCAALSVALVALPARATPEKSAQDRTPEVDGAVPQRLQSSPFTLRPTGATNNVTLGLLDPRFSGPDIQATGDAAREAVREAQRGLDKETIRRVIRSHTSEVNACYERGLVQRPEIQGSVLVQFTIAMTGEVVASVIQSSTLGDADVEECIAATARTWRFPKPKGGGIVVVSYPFVLKRKD